MGWLRASKTFGVPQATLRRKSQGNDKDKELGRYQTTFATDQETDLVNHIKTFESSPFGLISNDIRKLSSKLAVRNGIDNRFNKETKMAGELFLHWLKHFKKHANPSPEKKVLVLVDRHSSHVLSYAKETGIVMMSFHPHCTHRLQSLDVTFFAPLKTFYNQEVSKWLRTHPGRVVTQYQTATLFSETYGKAATNQNAVSGFAKTEI
ncbi:hypothetical protein ILUMI_19013 [Ignelater luminosus]|uniref:DDE-1 domain-containing protein n=1 Tax=Ignelater luminosus TaxID=2038154 RepID=A0A8K0G0B9_IGNLU|nr:hypothetical protein ILUMI_19013 [Ignelater luminosus]